MANKWAIQNGNWSDGSTWNDGVVPTVDDDVWLNGYTIQLTSTLLDIGNGNIRNDINPNTSLSGGILVSASYYNNVVINANFICSTRIFEKGSGPGGRYVTINGNVTCDGGINATLLYWTSYETFLTIIGNVDINNAYLVNRSGTSGYIIIVGNVYLSGLSSISSSAGAQGTFRVEVNGDVKLYDSSYYCVAKGSSNVMFQYAKVGGDLYYYTTANWTTQSEFSVGGNFHYNEVCNVNLSNIIFSQNVNFIYDGIQPNPNPYIIINPNSIENTYPQETDVSEGVVYGPTMEKEGTLTLPNESTVMKGVEYGDKVGTLEVIALSGATATADNISVVNLTEQEVERVKNCATVSTVQKCFEDFKE